jgi:hypothetical protein
MGVRIPSPAERRDALRQTTENAGSIIYAERVARDKNRARQRKLRLEKEAADAGNASAKQK